MTNKKSLHIAIRAAASAGRAIMEIYHKGDFQTVQKKDSTPLTIADKKANEIINEYLSSTDIPLISEENKELPYEERRQWKRCWIVDPLDGTKEFIKGNGEFTVNIALIENARPVIGVIYAPALQLLYFADVLDKKAYRISLEDYDKDVEDIIAEAEEIKPQNPNSLLRVVSSRSHMNKETSDFIAELENEGRKVEVISKGSSLKFCLVAEGKAQVYPRFGPTMEWDTAAGQAICEAVGLNCKLRSTGESMTYNRESLLNDHFLVSYER